MKKPSENGHEATMTKAEADRIARRIADTLEAKERLEAMLAWLDADLGRLLFDVHEREGWRFLGASSFVAFASEQCGISKSHVSRQVEFWQTLRDLEPVCSDTSKLTEYALRPLADIEDAEDKQAIFLAAGTNEPTASQLTDARRGYFTSQGKHALAEGRKCL